MAIKAAAGLRRGSLSNLEVDMHTLRQVVAVGAMSTMALAGTASAQVLGTFAWQMQPYCNKVSLTLTTTPSSPGGFTLDGVDDQCGASDKASAVGVATPNTAGNYTLNFTIITAPAGKPVHVSATVSPANGSGNWADSAGNHGFFALFGATPGLPARPLPASGLPAATITSADIAPGAIGVSNINVAQVQARVSGACPNGQALRGINADGTVVCSPGTVMLRNAGMGRNPDDAIFASPTTQNFVGPTVNVTLAAGQKVLMTVTKAMGAFSVAASGLYTIPCARLASLPTTSNASAIDYGAGAVYVAAHQVPPNTRADFTTTAVLSTNDLTAGQTFTIGMCASISAGQSGHWVNNDWGLITALITDAQ